MYKITKRNELPRVEGIKHIEKDVINISAIGGKIGKALLTKNNLNKPIETMVGSTLNVDVLLQGITREGINTANVDKPTSDKFKRELRIAKRLKVPNYDAIFAHIIYMRIVQDEKLTRRIRNTVSENTVITSFITSEVGVGVTKKSIKVPYNDRLAVPVSIIGDILKIIALSPTEEWDSRAYDLMVYLKRTDEPILTGISLGVIYEDSDFENLNYVSSKGLYSEFASPVNESIVTTVEETVGNVVYVGEAIDTVGDGEEEICTADNAADYTE